VSEREEGIVRKFLDCFVTGDVASAADHFANDGSYRTYAWQEPTVGVAAARAEWERQAVAWNEFRYELVNIASAGDVVFTERIDRGQSMGHTMAVHAVGVFEVDRSGKITNWREYADAKEIAQQRAE
jgi:limonene-1,2-epoxide hydrolase